MSDDQADLVDELAELDDMDDPTMAYCLGSLYAHGGLSLADNPWRWDCQGEDRVLRMRFALGYANAGGLRAPVSQQLREALLGKLTPQQQKATSVDTSAA